MTDTFLASLGWSDSLASQLGDDEGTPVRITDIARDRVIVITEDGPLPLVTDSDLSIGSLAVGDWVLTDGTRITRVLDRQTLLARRAAGETGKRQMIAANVDTLGIVTSCNADFNPARLERYLALAGSAGCVPLVILTKADLVPDPTALVRQAERLSPLVAAMAVDARDPETAALLAPWTGPGQTLALAGSSGVGKTSLTNTLTGGDEAVQGNRKGDTKGRHTTTARTMRQVTNGGWIIDMPGMRELGMADATEGIAQVFHDIEDLVANCRFNDCAHETEPGCAVQQAIADGTLAADRYERWSKLQREDRYMSETTAQARARNKRFGKMVREVTRHKPGR
ncbi:ribosome small subunit-dependent GTPase A [Chachezhania antarctica]|uniref:ribosome small subunit-dependent GTPase A n=1 Tax=Chachezhania antarctica TaxID=2340860 RepID=UPI000EB2D87C|nr:ribosome small subunit-dependent GTPase A [Chachezhania antarctica]